MRLRWSNAGHPPPLVLGADGKVEVLTGNHTDLLLGVDPATTRHEQETSLRPGEVALLYTDGLIERRGHDLDDGLARLQHALTDLAGGDLETLCDDLLARLLSTDPDDDVALLAVRLPPHP
jgi:serine phosphatase RsbU (regulator of sigma subunit)